MTASLRLIDLNALVDVSNYSSLETCIIWPCQRLCNSDSSSQLARSLSVCVCVSVFAHLTAVILGVSQGDKGPTE